MPDLDEIIDAFEIPENCIVDRRIPKRRILEEAPTPADRRRISDGVERIRWLAVLKTGTTGIAGYKGEEREVEEISLLRLDLRPNAQRDRVLEVVHRAIPYLLVLVAKQEQKRFVSLADKRLSLAEKSAMVLDGDVLSAEIDSEKGTEHVDGFLHQIALSRQPQASLYSAYRGWIDSVVALRAAHHTGQFVMPVSVEHADRRLFALKRIEMIDAEVANLRRIASKERQIAKRAGFNMRLQQLTSERATELDEL